MKTFILTTGILILLPFTLWAQANTEDVVYLKDGGIIRGEILEKNPNELIRIETAGRNVYVIMMDQVDEIKREPVPEPKFYINSGYVNRSGFDLLTGSRGAFRFAMVNAYQFNPWISAGIGIGFVHYDDPISLVPIFLDFNFRMLEANRAPFLFLKTGYNFSLHSNENMDLTNHSGGMMFNTGIGVQFNTREGFGWYLNAGYNVDNSNYEFDTFNQTVDNELSFRRIHFGMGFVFN